MKTRILILAALAVVCSSGWAEPKIYKKSLTELSPVSYDVGWGDMLVGACFENRKVTLDGEPCTEYIFAHAPSTLVYDIPRAATHFTAVGIAPEGLENPGTWIYQVKIDGKVAFESRPLQTYPDKQVPIEVAIPIGSKRIELRVSEMKDKWQDFSVWAKPNFEARVHTG